MSFLLDESAADILAEKGWLQGAIISGVVYGVDLTLYALCLYHLIRQIKKTRKIDTRRKYMLLVYISIVFVLATIYMGSVAKFTELAFIDNRDYPGGPNAYEQEMFSIPIDEMGNVSAMITTWLSDGILVWRCAIIYRGCRFPSWLVMLFPCLLFLSSFSKSISMQSLAMTAYNVMTSSAIGLLFLLQLSTSSPFGAEGHIDYTIPFISLSLALNVFVTMAIVARLYLFRRRVVSTLGTNYGAHYASLAAMIIESAAIYSFYLLAVLIPFSLNNPISSVFLQSLSQVQIAASFLIMFRVARGKGWMADTATHIFTTDTSRARFRTGTELTGIESRLSLKLPAPIVTRSRPVSVLALAHDI